MLNVAQGCTPHCQRHLRSAGHRITLDKGEHLTGDIDALVGRSRMVCHHADLRCPLIAQKSKVSRFQAVSQKPAVLREHPQDCPNLAGFTACWLVIVLHTGKMEDSAEWGNG